MKNFVSFLFVCMSINLFAVPSINIDSIQNQDIKDYTDGIIFSAQKGVEYRIKAGLSVGAATPLPIPAEIVEIKSFGPRMNLSIEAEVIKTFTEHWALSFGLRLETKGMTTDAKVKGYKMRMVADGSEIDGVWTGMEQTKLNNSYITLPVLAAYKVNKRWETKAGMYVSYMMNGDFSGAVYDGYLREGSPIGEKIEIDRATYDFSDNLNKFNYGVQLGCDWRAFPHLTTGIDLTWGLNNIFKKDFDVINFNMYPIYVKINFGYVF
jgi:hypothetical protein